LDSKSQDSAVYCYLRPHVSGPGVTIDPLPSHMSASFTYRPLVIIVLPTLIITHYWRNRALALQDVHLSSVELEARHILSRWGSIMWVTGYCCRILRVWGPSIN